VSTGHPSVHRAYNESSRIGPTLERLMATLAPQLLAWSGAGRYARRQG
jgi:hypothetical protein